MGWLELGRRVLGSVSVLIWDGLHHGALNISRHLTYTSRANNLYISANMPLGSIAMEIHGGWYKRLDFERRSPISRRETVHSQAQDT